MRTIHCPCVYCGRRTQRRTEGRAVCASHEDLPRLDPWFADLYTRHFDQYALARGSSSS